MPELPEVTTVINILKPHVIGKTIKNVDVFYPRFIKNELYYFKNTLQSKTILDIKRKGKFILFFLSDDFVLISHLRMEGKYTFKEKDDSCYPPHTLAIFKFENGNILIYHDTRKFGIMKLDRLDSYLINPPLDKLGIEPFDVDEDNIEELFKKFNKNKSIKELLLDQHILAGIGNIYCDEILYDTKINPFTKGKDLKKEQIIKIVASSKRILNEAILKGGSTIKSYHPSEGVDGRFQINLKAYGKSKQNCPICNTPFQKSFINGRGTTFCPNCQIDHSLEKAIGITGPIGSGKSEILNIFKKRNYFILDCDKIVKQLYNDDCIKNKVNKIFNYEVLKDGNLDFLKMRELMSKHSMYKSILENYIHPLVTEVLIENIKNHDHIVIEVQLLAKAHLEYLFKTILCVTSDLATLKQRLKNRNYKDIDAAIKLYYQDNAMDIDNKKVILFKNDYDDIQKLNKEINKLIDKLENN